MGNRIASLLMVLGFILFFAIPASAATGSIRVETQEDVELYWVGAPEGTGYRLTESCGGGYLTFDDTLSSELAAWLSGRVKTEKAIITDRNEPVFYDLEEGLYLVACQEAEGFASFLVTIPWDGYYWEVEVDPTGGAVPQTGDPIGYVILAMAVSGAGVMVISRRRKNY